MNELNIKILMGTVLDCLELHMRSSKDWHYGDPAYDSDEVPPVEGPGGLRELVMRQHWAQFRLHHMKEEGTGPTRISIMETKLDAVTDAVDAHMAALLGSMGYECPSLDFGSMMRRMSALSLDTYHLREEAEAASHKAAHAPENERLARQAEGLLEKVGELDTLRMVQGREMLDALLDCSSTEMK